MAELTKGEIFREAQEKIKPITSEVEGRKKKLVENAAVIISFSVIALSIILYAFNTGYCKVFNLPTEVMSLDMTRLLPLAFQILSIATFILLYISSIKADRALKRNRFNFVRIIWGVCIVSHFFSVNNVPSVIGKWWNFLLTYLIPVLVETMIYWAKKPKKATKVTEAEHQTVLEDTVQDSIFATYYIRYGIFAIVLPFVFAPMLGEFSANAEREYQTFVVNNATYAVVVDYEDKVLVQQAIEQDGTLQIDTSSFTYFDKKDIVLRYKEYTSVSIRSVEEVEQPTTQNNSWNKLKEVLSMPSITDWLMVIITFVYVVATIFICVANVKSARATKAQLAESQKQFRESNRPYVTCEYILTNRVFCGIRLCNHGNQVARNLSIKINKEFLDSLTDNEFGNFRKINDSVYTVVGVGQSFKFYFSSVNSKPTEVPLIASVSYNASEDNSYEEVFEIDLAKQLPIESVESDVEKYMKLLKEQNQILSKITK